MLGVGGFAVVVDFECCAGFEVGTCVEIVGESYDEDGLHYYVCRSHSPESQWSDLNLLQCHKCLYPIKDTDGCTEVHDEY